MMSYQAYLDNIKAKTGKTPADFKKLASEKGLLIPGIKAGQIVAWLKEEFGLGHGHATAIYGAISPPKQSKDADSAMDKHFKGKEQWKESFDLLLSKLRQAGEVVVAPTNTYISLLKGERKFAIVQLAAKHMDIGIKAPDLPPGERFQPAGKWNTMVTHRVRLSSVSECDKEVLKWIKHAYESR